jgi:hypothetical protein
MLTEQDARLIARIDFSYTPEHAPVLPGRKAFQLLTPRRALCLVRGPGLRRIDESLEIYNITRLDLLKRHHEYVAARDQLCGNHTAAGLDRFLAAQQAHLVAFCASQWAFREVSEQVQRWLRRREWLIGRNWFGRKATPAPHALLSFTAGDASNGWFASPDAALAVENSWQFNGSLRVAS